MERNSSDVVGIDLGTTRSAVAYPDDIAQEGVCIMNENGSYVTPSVVCIDPKKGVIVGDEARDGQMIHSERTASLFKRKMGVEKVALKVDGKEYSPIELSKYVLEAKKADVERELGKNIKDAVITIPAYFNSAQTEDTKEAGKAAGYNVLDELHEPVAAFISTILGLDSLDRLVGNTYLVYDWGGGTLDIVVIRVTEKGIEELIIAGALDLGGADHDQAFVDMIKRVKLPGATFGVEDEQELLTKAEKAKMTLSQKTETQFSVATLNEGRKQVEVTRAEFEECIKDSMDRAASILEDVKEQMKQKNIDHIDQVILAGGSTKIPVVTEMLKECFPGTEIIGKDVDLAVAKGAAIYGKILKDKKLAKPKIWQSFGPDNTIVKELIRVSSRNYGVAAYCGDKEYICTMIPQNSKLPFEAEATYSTRYDKQTSARIAVYETNTEGERVELDEGNQIGACTLKIGAELPAYSPITVSIHLDESGILHLTGKEKVGNTSVEATMEITRKETL